MRFLLPLAAVAAARVEVQFGDCPIYKKYPYVKLKKSQGPKAFLAEYEQITSANECGSLCLHTLKCEVYQHSADLKCILAEAGYEIVGNADPDTELYIPHNIVEDDPTCEGLRDLDDFDCQAIKERNSQAQSGRYIIKTMDGPCGKDSKCCAEVSCIMHYTNFPWTVFQRRTNGKESFDKSYEVMSYDYGDEENSWLGLEHLRRLTENRVYVLRIELGDFNGHMHDVEFQYFSVKGPKHTLHLSGDYNVSHRSLNGKTMLTHSGYDFTTYDRDQDANTDRNCAVDYQAAWWYHACFHNNLNGPYPQNGPNVSEGFGILWRTHTGDKTAHSWSYKTSQMMIRRPGPGHPSYKEL